MDRIFSLPTNVFLKQKVDRIFPFPTNVFVESTAFAFVSYVCWFDINFDLIAEINFSN